MTEKREMKLHVGMASIVTIFAVLCLTVFAVLTMLSANSEKKLAESAASAICSYYTAEAAIYDRLAELEADLIADRPLNAQITVYDDGGETICYIVTQPIDHARLLTCAAQYDGHRLTILSMRVADADDWTPETLIRVWRGE